MFEWLIVGGALGRPGERSIAVRLAVLAAQIAVLALAVRGVIKARAPRAELALLLVCLPLALLAVDAAGVDGFYVERSGLPVLPFLATAIGIGVASCARMLWRASSIAVITALGTVVLVNYYAKSDRKSVV